MSKHKKRKRRDAVQNMNDGLNGMPPGMNNGTGAFGNNFMNNSPFVARNPMAGQPGMNNPLSNLFGGGNNMNPGMMGQNPMAQMGQNPMGQMGPMGPIRPGMGAPMGGGLLGAAGSILAPLFAILSNVGNSPLMQLLGNVDMNAISKMLFNNNNNNANSNNAINQNDINNTLNNSGGLTDLLNNLDENKVNDLLKNVDQTQITNIINQLKNEGVVEDNPEGVFNDPGAYDMGYSTFDDDEMNIGEENYSSLKMIKIINAMLNSGNTDFIKQVVDLYNNYYGVTE